MTLWGVEIFLAVVEEQSISGAAKRLGVSPATISQQITNLESALGGRLLDRTARPLGVTAAGHLFLRRAQAIMAEADRAEAELAQADLSLLSRLRLGMIEDFDADVTPRLLAEMSEELKSCHFVLETGASYHLASMLEARALDMIVAADQTLSAAGMVSLPLLQDPYILAVPPGVLVEGDPMPQLLDLPFIRYNARQMMGRQIEAHLTAEGLNIPHRFELDSYHAIMAMVAGGAGWTITTPLGYMRALRFRDGVEVHPLPVAPLVRRIALFARQDALEDMPGQIAGRLKPLLADMVIAPGLAAMPWLEDQLTLL